MSMPNSNPGSLQYHHEASHIEERVRESTLAKYALMLISPVVSHGNVAAM